MGGRGVSARVPRTPPAARTPSAAVCQILACSLHPFAVQEGKTPADYARQCNKAEALAVLEAAAAGRR